MKKIFLLISMVTLFSSALFSQQFIITESPIKYTGGELNTILKQAKTEDKMVFANFYQARNAACRVTAKFAMVNDTVVEFMDNNFINIKFNIEDTLANKAVMEKYHVTGWEFLFLDVNGDIKYRFGGGGSSFNAHKFLQQTQTALERKHTNVKDGVQFIIKPFPAVLEAAAMTNKMVFVDCYTKWCVPCAEMANTVFTQKQMGDYFKPVFISTKLDMETAEGLELNKKYKITSYPTFLILNAKGDELGRILGAMQAERFIQKVELELQKIK